MRVVYKEKQFKDRTLRLIMLANNVIGEYQRQGFSLTLRQLYYQLVARGFIPNTKRDYKRLSSIINDARLAGLVDWLAIVDRTRTIRGNQHWSSPKSIVEAAISTYKIDRWYNQPYRVEAWIEKDALIGVLSGICHELDIDYFSCRGYASASSMWKAAQRLAGYRDDSDQWPIVLYLGDHDPSGIDMVRDISDRLELFSDGPIEVRRIALTMDQIRTYRPPPNPAKVTDSRFQGYATTYGRDCWELDALEPQVIHDLVENRALGIREEDPWEEACGKEGAHIEELKAMIKGRGNADSQPL